MTESRGIRLSEVALPEFELPRDMPVVPEETYRARVEKLYDAMQERGLDALGVYGDREHFANTSYLTGFDPRYEESLMVFVPGRTPRLIVGNESVAYAGITPYEIEIVRLSKFSLVGQPDPGDLTLAALLREAGLADPSIARFGFAGWKYWTGAGTENWIDVPSFIVTEVAKLVDTVENATDIFSGPAGIRLVNDVDQLAYFEFAAGHGSQAMLRLLSGIRPGMTELEASSLMRPILLPFNYHPTMLSGTLRTGYGVASPSGRELAIGDRVSAGIGYWGSNTARAGYLVESASQLPSAERDYLEKVAAPYYATAAAWYEAIRIGLTAGELYETVASRIGDEFYGVFLNPGHHIHLDEWPMSPVTEGSPVTFVSGNAIQLDIIPSPAGYQGAQIEDGIVLADSALRAELSAKYPRAMSRIERRRTMLTEVFGIELHESVLPLSNTAGYLPPFWLSPHLAMVKA